MKRRALVTGATGMKQKHVGFKDWCSHIEVCNCASNDELKNVGIKLGGDLVFMNEGTDACFHHVPYYWRFCPLCAIPRPKHLRTDRRGQIIIQPT